MDKEVFAHCTVLYSASSEECHQPCCFIGPVVDRLIERTVSAWCQSDHRQWAGTGEGKQREVWRDQPHKMALDDLWAIKHPASEDV